MRDFSYLTVFHIFEAQEDYHVVIPVESWPAQPVVDTDTHPDCKKEINDLIMYRGSHIVLF